MGTTTNFSNAQKDMLAKVGEKGDKGYAAVRGQGRALGKLNADGYIVQGAPVQGADGGTLWTLTPKGKDALAEIKTAAKAAARKAAK